MYINERTFEITTSQYDYGVPVIFEAGTQQGFQINDTVIFTFDTDKIEDKIFTVDSEDYTFGMSLTKEEADSLQLSKLSSSTLIKYSIKRYREEQFLETLVDSVLKIKATVKWEEGEDNGEASSP